MGTEVKNIHVSTGLVYIAGVETPVSDIQVSYGVGRLPEATITVPSCEEFIRFGEEDRVPIAIFYLDQWHVDSGKDDDLKSTFRLLFDGEIFGWSYSKTANGDSISLFAIANMAMLQNISANFLIGQDAPTNAVLVENVSSTQAIKASEIRTWPLVLLNKGLFQGPEEPIERPFDFIENMLLPLKIGGYPNSNAVGSSGVRTDDFQKAVTNAEAKDSIAVDTFAAYVNKDVPISAIMGFFIKYTHRTKFDKRWMATPLEEFLNADSPTEFNNIKDPTFLAVKNEITLRALQRSLESTFGQGDSFLKILMTFYSLCSYEILMLPTAQYVQVGVASGATSAAIQDAGIPVNPNRIIKSKNGKRDITAEFRLGQYISKPVCQFAIPPECNIILPCMIENFTFQEDYSKQATRTVAGNPFLDLALRQANSTPENAALIQAATTNGYPVDVMNQLHKPSGNQFSNLLLYPEEYFKGPVTQNVTVPAWYQMLREASSQYERANKIVRSEQNQKSSDGTDTQSAAAKEQAFAAKQAQFADAKVGAAPPELTDVVRKRYLKERDNREMLAQYTRMMHFEQRFGTRAGSVEMAFNPYIVPGFPFAMLDKGASKMHVTGLVSGVTQRISAIGGMSTSVQYSYGRTLKETYEIAIQTLIDLAKTQKNNLPGFYATAPLLPVVTLADTLQLESNAADFYKRLFFNTTSSKKYIFKFDEFFNTTSFADVGAIPTSDPVSPGSTTYRVVLDYTRSIQSSGVMVDYNKAMRKISRPICSLEDYVTFINGNTSSDKFFESSNLLNPNVYGIAVPLKIRDYSVGNADLSDHYITPTVKSANIKNADADLRRDWVTRIMSYRTKVHGRRIQSV